MLTNGSFEYCTYLKEGQRIGFRYFQDNRHVLKPLALSVTAIILAPVISCSNGLIFWAILRNPALRIPANLLICWLSGIDTFVGLLYLPLFASSLLASHSSYFCLLVVLRSFKGWIFCTGSFLTMVAISCERYLALFYPLQYTFFITTKRLLLVVTLIGLISILLSSFVLMGASARPLRYSIGSMFLTLGLLVICGTYARIFKLVRRHHHQINAQQIGDTNNARQRKLAVTMAYVIGVSLICYLPMGLVLVDIVIQGQFTVHNTGFFVLSELLFSMSSLLNPFIYCLKNLEIRNAVIQLLRSFRKTNTDSSWSTRIGPSRPNCTSVRKPTAISQSVEVTLPVRKFCGP